MAGSDKTVALRLQEIAEVLGVPVEALYDRGASQDCADLAEFLRLWWRLKTPASRAAALAALRQALDEENSRA